MQLAAVGVCEAWWGSGEAAGCVPALLLDPCLAPLGVLGYGRLDSSALVSTIRANTTAGTNQTLSGLYLGQVSQLLWVLVPLVALVVAFVGCAKHR